MPAKFFKSLTLPGKLPSSTASWDVKVTQHQPQKELKKEKNQLVYELVEARFINNYACLLDITLRNTLFHMQIDDLANNEGYERKDKATEQQTKYFKQWNDLVDFIKNNIEQHRDLSPKIHAFRRWISVADLLVQRHNYEGLVLVISALAVLDTSHKLVEKLTEEVKIDFERLFKLGSPPFRKLTEHMQSNANPQQFMPLGLLSLKFKLLEPFYKKSCTLDSDSLANSHPDFDPQLQKEKLLEQMIKAKPPKELALPKRLEDLLHPQKNTTSFRSIFRSNSVKPCDLHMQGSRASLSISPPTV